MTRFAELDARNWATMGRGSLVNSDLRRHETRADKKPPGARPGGIRVLGSSSPVVVVTVTVRAERAADEKAAWIVSISGIAVITVRVVRRRRIIAHSWKWYTNTDIDSCLGGCRR
jgi:hypothetical protein